jgi:sialate O-acetylesterase
MKNLRLARPVLFFSAVLAASGALFADIVPAVLFTDHAVLQRDKPVPVWGSADAGEKVSVTFAGQSVETVADASGKWRVQLSPLAARSEGSELVIQGKNKITLTDVVVGEVWLASGQSNMEYMVKQVHDSALEIPASAANPLVRHIKINKIVGNAPAAVSAATWRSAGPDTTGEFSAVGYYFALDIHRILNVPVGIIGSNWGGTPVESWMSPAAFATVPDIAIQVEARWATALANYPAAQKKYVDNLATWQVEQAAAKAAQAPFTKRKPRPPAGPGHQNTPSGLYQGMIAPLVPYALRGTIWYQGEANAGRANEYHALFSALIQGWRADFAQGDFPFYWVQLANYQLTEANNWAFLREAQTKTLALPATGQAVVIDLGDANDIHPRNKRDVGRRLARLALARDYNIAMIDSGPVFAGAERTGHGFRVRFTRAEGGLFSPKNELTGFEVAGADKIFKPARAAIEDGTVLVNSAEVTEPVALRYAWQSAPEASVFNREGLPAGPFRTDTW